MREIKFRAWDKESHRIKITGMGIQNGQLTGDGPIMQFTGLKDKNGLTSIFEGDIIDENGLVRGNIYESPSLFREGIDLVIAGMGTSAWRSAESIAMGRGCQYAE